MLISACHVILKALGDLFFQIAPMGLLRLCKMPCEARWTNDSGKVGFDVFKCKA